MRPTIAQAWHRIRGVRAKVMLVTGASSGLGAAAAHRLAREPEARLVLVARRAERLAALAAALPAPADWIAVDLTAADAPERVRAHVEEHHGRLDVLVNNAGRGARGRFGDVGYANVRAAMELNFDAQLRLTEALLPLLRRSAPSAIVNVASAAARVARPGTAAYSASKAALAVWSDGLHAEEAPYGVHVGTVLPGFIPTEGFPQRELAARRITRRLLGTPEEAAEAIAAVAVGGRAERYVPRFYGALAALRTVAPPLVRRVMARGGADRLATATRE
jgi:short-subunit dehydrogenase